MSLEQLKKDISGCTTLVQIQKLVSDFAKDNRTTVMQNAKSMDALRNMFDVYDTSKDGQVSKDEAALLIMDMLNAGGRAKGVACICKDAKDSRVLVLLNQFWGLFDADESGYLSKEEFCKVAIPCVTRVLAQSGTGITLSDEEWHDMAVAQATIKMRAGKA